MASAKRKRKKKKNQNHSIRSERNDALCLKRKNEERKKIEEEAEE